MSIVDRCYSPYRMPETPLTSRERILEQELVATREMLDAYCNEEVRIERAVLRGEATRAELAAITATVETLMGHVSRLTYELECVRAEIVWRGERRHVRPYDPNQGPIWPLWLGALFFALVVAAALLLPLVSERQSW